MGKVFVLGLDGATFDVIRPMTARGTLPTFAELLEKGGHGTLPSTIPALSPPAWTSFATGKNPGKHGIIGFAKMLLHNYKLELVCGLDTKVRTLWELLSEHGKRVIVVNVPMTYPPKPVNGLLVSGLDTPGLHADFTFPPQLKEELLGVAEDYSINLHLGGYLQTDKRRHQALKMILSSIDARQKVVKYLMQKYPWDFFVVRFNNPDIVQHHFWKYMDPNHPDFSAESAEDFKQAIYTVYQKLDRVAADILKRLDDGTTLVVLSDHGAGPRINKAIYINEWLQSQGYLSLANESTQTRQPLQASVRAFYQYLHKLMVMLLSFAHPRLKGFLKRLLPYSFSQMSLFFKFSEGLSAIHWAKTVAFLAEEDSIRIHLKTRYPEGIVEPEAYEALRDELIGKLATLRDPETGEPLFDKILKREEIYRGPYSQQMPDIFLVTKDSRYDVSGKCFRNQQQAKFGHAFVCKQTNWSGANGRHRPDGIFLINGPHCQPKIELKDLSLTDILPTILFAMGLPIPRDVDGRVLTEAFTEDFLQQNTIRYTGVESALAVSDGVEVYSDRERAQVLAHLKGLGYIE